MDSLAQIDRASQMLAEAVTLDDIKAVRDMATAAEAYAKAAKLGLQAQNSAAAIKLRAEHKAGELLRELEREQGGSGRFGSSDAGQTSEYTTALDAAGATRQDAHRWQKLAAIPADELETIITETTEAGKELTTGGLLSSPHVAKNSGYFSWYTPTEYVEAARDVMWTIDLDPASSDTANEVVQAATYFTPENDGLEHPWSGNVWLNPPYSTGLIGPFCDKLAMHFDAGDVSQACVLVNNATETDWFSVLASRASAVCFPKGRVKFWDERGSIGAPLQGQAILYFGDRPGSFRGRFGFFGWTALL